MVNELELTPGRGGDRHPLSSRVWIADHLAMVGEDYISNMHGEYVKDLRKLAESNGRLRTNREGKVVGRPYHKPTYHSFEMAVQNLARSGVITFSGREEVSDSPQFTNWPEKPVRRYYRLAVGG
jgi:hypothetical protein